MLFRRCLVLSLIAAALVVLSCEDVPAVSMAFVTPKDGQRVARGPVTVKVRWSVSDCHAESVALKVDGVLVGMDTVPADTCCFTWDASQAVPGTAARLKAGLYYSYATTSGAEHNAQRVESISVTVDTGGPSLHIVSPRDGDTVVKGNVPIKAWAKDTSALGMEKVEFLVDEELKGTVSEGVEDTWRYTWDASQASTGAHDVKVKAYNGYGEKAVEAVGVWVRDTTSGSGPTYHSGYVDTNEVWSPAGNPHLVTGTVSVRNGATVEIQPGCLVRFYKGMALYCGQYAAGAIKAIGRSDAPIIFTSNEASPAHGDWGYVGVYDSAPATTEFSYCTFEYGGSSGQPCVIVGNTMSPAFDHCIVRLSGGPGIVCGGASGGFRVFQDNEVTGNAGFPVTVSAQYAATIGSGNALGGNDSTGVLLNGSIFIQASTTWPDLGVPYIVNGSLVVYGTASPVLTIAPNTTVKFRPGTSLGANDAGSIVADGSAGAITFTATNSAAEEGFIVHIYSGATVTSSFKNCRFEYGGDDYNWPNGGCLMIDECRPVVSGCDVGVSSTWGILLSGETVPDTLQLKQENTFHDNSLGDVHWLGH